MAYNPNLPASHAPIVSQELRDQFNGLKALIDAQAAQITALQAALNSKVTRAAMGEFDPGYSDPPTYADLMKLQGAINDIIGAID